MFLQYIYLLTLYRSDANVRSVTTRPSGFVHHSTVYPLIKFKHAVPHVALAFARYGITSCQKPPALLVVEELFEIKRLLYTHEDHAIVYLPSTSSYTSCLY